jgi:hypothetical protein
LSATAAANGLDLARLGRSLTGVPRFAADLIRYRRGCRALGINVPAFTDLLPVTSDRSEKAGAVDGHYFHQDLWAARKVHRAAPTAHVDVGSRIDGFVAHVLSFCPVTVVDIRPLSDDIPGLTWVRDDARTLASFADGSVPSVSSLHAVEHVGLGRYGDDLDPEGWRSAVAALQRITAPGGTIYLGLPIGRQRTCFNAHRVLDPRTVVDALDGCTVVEFSAVTDEGRLVLHAEPDAFQNSDYACGLFELRRRTPTAAA